MNNAQDIKKAIDLDCLQLIENFCKNKNVQFKIFCTEWKKIHFHHIYSCQIGEIDMVHTTIEAFHLCKTILINDNHQLKKIGSIYLLYTLYYKQPTFLYVKIEVCLKTWQAIKEFINSVESDNDCIQIRYIFWKLVSDNAFRFVESEIYYGLEPFFNREQDYTIPTLSSEKDIFKNEMSNFIDDNKGFIKGFELLENNYNNMKNIINETNKNESSYVPIEPTNFLATIKEDMLSINDLFNIKSNTDEKEDFETMNEIKFRRSKIREKAFSKNIQSPGTSKNMRIDITDDDSQECLNTCTVEPESSSTRISKLNYLKLVLQETLPDEFEKELGDKNI